MNETQVSKTNPTIKKIIASTVQATVPGSAPWKGRKVSVDQVDDSWTYQLYNDTGEPFVYVSRADGSSARRIPAPRYGGPPTPVPAPSNGDVVLIHHRFDSGSITIVIPTLDPAPLSVALDAWLTGDSASKKRAKAILREVGPYAGIAEAITEAQAKTFSKPATVEHLTRSSGGRPHHATRKSSRELERDIGEALAIRNLTNANGTRNAAGKLLSLIARSQPSGIEVTGGRKEPALRVLLDAGYVTYGLHPSGHHRANVTSLGRDALVWV